MFVMLLGYCVLPVVLVVCVFLYKALQVQLEKIQLYEFWIREQDDALLNIHHNIKTTYLNLKTIDDRDLFYKDDDVGFIFTDLLDQIQLLNVIVTKTINDKPNP